MARRVLKSNAPATKTVTASCFGAVLSWDTSDAQGARSVKAAQVFNDSLAAAIDGARDKVRIDRRRQAVYQTSNRAKSLASPSATGLSLLDDCGLPLVSQFGSFVENLHGEVSADTLPFVGFGSQSRYGRDTVAPLWTTSPLSVLAKVIPFTFGLLNAHYQLINYLARLNSSDDIWQPSKNGLWFNQFGGPLKTYMTDLFANRFRDRNGTAMSFDLATSASPKTSLDPKQISPQLAGGIVSAFVEFLGDQLYQVPFYSQDILATYRQQRDDAGTAQNTQAILDKLTGAVTSGKISAEDASTALGIPKANNADLAVVFDRITQSGKDTPVVALGLARMTLAKIGQLDAALLAQNASISAASNSVTQIQNQTSALQTAFTCFNAGIITANLECEFVVDGVTGAAHGVCANDAGRSIAPTGDNFDYADLVGKLVAFGSTTAEKSVRSIVGGLVRGVSIASLQNDVIAEIIASIAGGLARKFVESASYTGITNFIDGTNGVDAATKQAHLTMLATALGLTK